MALQGTIETFALPDVLRLLATTKKSGRLRLSGSRGSGSVWLDAGSIVASEATGHPHADTATDVVFELLRFTDGDFVFNDTELAAAPDAPDDVETVLAAAEAQLEEWETVAAVVPSVDLWVSLAAEAPDDEVTLSRDEWTSLVTIGGGATVAAIGDVLALAELPLCRKVKGLVERGLVELGDVPSGAGRPAEPVFERAAEPAAEPEPVFEADAALDEFEPVVEFEEPVVDERPSLEVVPSLDDEPDHEPFDPNGLVIEEPTFGASETLPEFEEDEPAAAAADEPEPDAAEIARQLANLSPKAAKAVAAAAKATTEEERMAALADVDENEDGFNRDLLLKFLGSMNG